MRRLLFLTAFLSAASPVPTALAQNGAEIIQGILGLAVEEIERHQRREQQKGWARERRDQFNAAWQACFGNDLAACQHALKHRPLHPNDRTKLITQRKRLITTMRQQDRRAEAEARRRNSLARAAHERRQAAQRAAAVRRQQERRAEQQRALLSEAFARSSIACTRYDRAACERALRSPLAQPADTVLFQRMITVVKDYQTNRIACEAGDRTACEAALASSAQPAADQALLADWRARAHPMQQVLASVTSLPTSTWVVGSLALLLSLVLGWQLLVRRQSGPDTLGFADVSQPATEHVEEVSERSSSIATSVVPSDSETNNSSEAIGQSVAPVPPTKRDTPTAVAALELAKAYLEEVQEASRPGFEDTATRRRHLSTLALAAKQLTIAEKNDPDAELVISDGNGAWAFSLANLKAQALILEARSYDDRNSKKALPPLRQAVLIDPNNATAHYLLGVIEAANMNRTRAVDALQTAVALEPDNLEFKKELNRTESISAAEVATYKATRLGERAYDTGVTAWNIFAITWNVMTWPFRAISTIMRVVFRIT